jgi:Secretion system C-terminal sorting domain/Bacterial Ig-like domain (group 2)/Matrixin
MKKIIIVCFTLSLFVSSFSQTMFEDHGHVNREDAINKSDYVFEGIIIKKTVYRRDEKKISVHSEIVKVTKVFRGKLLPGTVEIINYTEYGTLKRTSLDAASLKLHKLDTFCIFFCKEAKDFPFDPKYNIDPVDNKIILSDYHNSISGPFKCPALDRIKRSHNGGYSGMIYNSRTKAEVYQKLRKYPNLNIPDHAEPEVVDSEYIYTPKPGPIMRGRTELKQDTIKKKVITHLKSAQVTTSEDVTIYDSNDKDVTDNTIIIQQGESLDFSSDYTLPDDDDTYVSTSWDIDGGSGISVTDNTDGSCKVDASTDASGSGTLTVKVKYSYDVQYVSGHTPSGDPIWSTETDYDELTGTCTIHVHVTVTGITIDQSSPQTLFVNGPIQLSASVNPSTADQTVDWQSNDPSIATVSTSGVVTAVSGGSTTIVAKSDDDNSKTASCTINVQPQINSITINSPDNTFIAGRGYIITINGSGFSNDGQIGKFGKYVSFTNSDWGGNIVPNEDDNGGTTTVMINDYDDYDYSVSNSWSDTQIKMYLPSEIFENNFGKNYIYSIAIGTGCVTVTNSAFQTSPYTVNQTDPSYIIIPNSCKTHWANDGKKYPVFLGNVALAFSAGKGISDLSLKGIDIINKAMKEWSCRLGTQLTFDANSESTLSTICFTSLGKGEAGETYTDLHYYDGDTHATNYLSTIYINSDNDWQLDPYPEDDPVNSNPGLPGNDIEVGNSDLYNTILHELGHSLMLEHINDKTSIMYYNQKKSPTIVSDRIDLRNQTNAIGDAEYILKNSNLSSYNTTNCPPLPPTNLKPSLDNNNCSQVNLSWDYAWDMDYYVITRNDGVVMSSPGPNLGAGTISYTDNLCNSSTSYTYTLKAVNSFGSASTSSASITTQALATPGSINNFVSTNGKPTITWSGNTSTYTIYRSDNGGKTYSPIGTSTTTSYTDVNAIPGTVYMYEIQAKSGSTTKTSSPITVPAISVNTSCSNISPINYTSTSQVPSGASYTTTTITAGTSVAISGSKVIEFLAGTKVVLTQGFSVTSTNGSYFKAEIVPCGATSYSDSVPRTLVTDVKENEKVNDISFYPNPTNGIFTVAINSSETFIVSVYNITGNLIKVLANCQNKTIIDIKGCPSGIYIIKVSGRSSTYTCKLVKN